MSAQKECFIGNERVECPRDTQVNTSQVDGRILNLFPSPQALETRSDFLFSSLVGGVILVFAILAALKIKIFGKTLGEYTKPIWYFILVAILTVLWQYLVGLQIEDNALPIRISQWVWELAVLASAYRLSKIPGFSYGNMFFLGILYSLIIHGLKVSIRYFFYAKTFGYIIDRFLYGGLLVMAIAFVLGSVFVYLRNKKSSI
jgi:hypothetical protein